MDHQRFFHEVTTVWEELRSWESELKLHGIHVHLDGGCAYELLGPMMRLHGEVTKYLIDDDWMLHSALPTLPTVASLTVSACTDIDLWPEIVGCDVAASLPNIQELRLHSADWQKRWIEVRREFRNILSRQLTQVPHSALRSLELFLPFRYSMNHDGGPGNLLHNETDLLSESLNSLSTHLTTLSLNLNQISPALFWNPSIPFTSRNASLHPRWPHLAHIHIDTGFETASGEFSMREPDSSIAHRPFYSDPPDADDVSVADSDQEIDLSLGDYPTALYRVRPEPDYFNLLAISIARAASYMPSLKSITIEMISYYTDLGMYPGYHGWGFAFRSGADARLPAVHTRAWTGYPGIDMYDLERPRYEWVFRCESDQVAWEEPAEAKQLWEERFPGIEMDLVTFDFCDDEDCWWSDRFDVCIKPRDMANS